MIGNALKYVYALLGVIIGFVVVYYIVGGTAETLTDSATQISGSSLPLASLFSSSGVIFIIFMIALFVGLIALAFKAMKN
jgi:hypothetical protein